MRINICLCCSEISQPESALARREGALSFPNGLIDLCQPIATGGQVIGNPRFRHLHWRFFRVDTISRQKTSNKRGKKGASSIIHPSSMHQPAILQVQAMHEISIKAQRAFDLLKLGLLKAAMVGSIKFHTDLGYDFGTFSLP